uniref:Movement protein n=1 Tax=Raspberry bushy dwarf virus TaxID=12451 RepID=Q3SA52_RBDV|nr:movement protein [Raspberry bushy dwarf virus]
MFNRGSSTRRSLVGSRGGSIFGGGSSTKSSTVRGFSAGLERSRGLPPAGDGGNQVSLPGLRIPVKASSQPGNYYLKERGIDLPIVQQQKFLAADGKEMGECYLLDTSRTDLLDAAKAALNESKLLEFNKFKEFKKYKGKNNEFPIVEASIYEKLVRKDETPVHLNRLLIAVVPAVGKGTPGSTRIKVRDARLEDGYGELFSSENRVDAGYIYCINVGYSVPKSEIDYKINIDFIGVPIKDGKSPIWVKAAFCLAGGSPVFLDGTMSLGAEILPDSHKEMLGTSALLLNEANSNRKSFSGDDGELKREYPYRRFEEISPLDSISQVDTASQDSTNEVNTENAQNSAGEVYLAPPSHSVY